jgi:hypothetical protein
MDSEVAERVVEMTYVTLTLGGLGTVMGVGIGLVAATGIAAFLGWVLIGATAGFGIAVIVCVTAMR